MLADIEAVRAQFMHQPMPSRRHSHAHGPRATLGERRRGSAPLRPRRSSVPASLARRPSDTRLRGMKRASLARVTGVGAPDLGGEKHKHKHGHKKKKKKKKRHRKKLKKKHKHGHHHMFSDLAHSANVMAHKVGHAAIAAEHAAEHYAGAALHAVSDAAHHHGHRKRKGKKKKHGGHSKHKRHRAKRKKKKANRVSAVIYGAFNAVRRKAKKKHGVRDDEAPPPRRRSSTRRRRSHAVQRRHSAGGVPRPSAIDLGTQLRHHHQRRASRRHSAASNLKRHSTFSVASVHARHHDEDRAALAEGREMIEMMRDPGYLISGNNY